MITDKGLGDGRRVALAQLAELRRQRGSELRVLDVGGSMDRWASEYVTDYIDVLNVQGTRTFVGDACDWLVWQQARRTVGMWDYVICSHLLEDVRDPKYVVSQLESVGRAGYIAMPNKHTEMTKGIESDKYPGYCHHRWMFSVVGGGLTALAKFPLTSELTLSWVEAKNLGLELWMTWKDTIDLTYVNGDFAGQTKDEMKRLFEDFGVGL